MLNLNIGIENIIASNGIIISVLGMLIVFAALSVISLFIAYLPKVLPLTEKIFPVAHHHSAPESSLPQDHEQVLAAIGYALFHKELGSLPAK